VNARGEHSAVEMHYALTAFRNFDCRRNLTVVLVVSEPMATGVESLCRMNRGNQN
jgi:hypothetical protein